MRRWIAAGLVFLGVLTLGGVAQAQKPTGPAPAGLAKATFAGGCFWCMEAPFDKLDGVLSTTSGYIGGKKVNPTYQEVSAGTTGHTEAVEIVYDPKKVSFEKLLEVFWRNIDPTDKAGQFCDRGSQYRPELFVHDAEQRKLAETSKTALMKSKPFRGDIAVDITEASVFYAAEDYHQDYYKKNPIRYSYYRNGCGRDARLETLWGKQAK
jgi:peptide-methionine (S)-S-oxide reductase